MNLYAYCLSDEITADAIEMAGVAGAPVRLAQMEDINVVVSDFDGTRAEVSKENVLAHENVNRRVLARVTPLPFRFGTVVSQTQLEDFVRSEQARLLRQLEDVRGTVEMSVKIIWDAEARKSAAIEQADASRVDDAMLMGPGAAFLDRKRREYAFNESLKKQADEIAAWLDGRVSGAVKKSVVRTRPSEVIVIDAAHLVERRRLDEYRALVEAARGEREGLRFLTSGAWPPYSFSGLD
jgi:Gas vesicle synthesis protein GvpL/GvpF